MSDTRQLENALDEMTIIPLGGGQEVGRSCILLKFKDRFILLDCGSHPGREGDASLPEFDTMWPNGPEDVDLVLITHFHIDHCASLPYFTEKTNFKGRIFMTHATKAVMKLLLTDNLRLQNKQLYSQQDLQRCIDKIEVIDYHQTIEYRGVKFTATAAGHVLGAAMFTIEIDGIRVLYTGDYSMEEDRHLIQAEVPNGKHIDVLIVESTFGVQNLPSSEDREKSFTETIEKIVTRGGSCLIPVFALGRAQELLLILDDFWQNSPHLSGIPVYYASRLASKALRVYQTFANMMNNHIRSLMDVKNPFKFNNIANMVAKEFDSVGPCVVMASPGFLTSGVSRALFDRWCDDERNGVIIAGYTIEGTLAHDLWTNLPKEVTCLDNRIKPRRCDIKHISFSAHVDFKQNMTFIKACKPDYIILVHGEKTGMSKLKTELEREIRKNWPVTHKPFVAMPDNGTKVRLSFNRQVAADVLGTAAMTILTAIDNDNTIDNINEKDKIGLKLKPGLMLVSENYVSKVVNADELGSYTSCRLGSIMQRCLVPIPSDLNLNDNYNLDSNNSMRSELEKETKLIFELILPHLEELFDGVAITDSWIQIHGHITITYSGKDKNINNSVSSLNVEWSASPMSDLIADSVVGTLLQILSTPSVLRLTINGSTSHSKRKKCGHINKEEQAVKIEDTIMHEEMVKKMKLGMLDPSKTLPKDAISVNIKDNNTSNKDHDIRLKIIHKDLMNSSHYENFSSISLNSIGKTLIFKDKIDNKSKICTEAYCYILWGSSDNHDAVIQCEDEIFREKVINAMNSLANI